MDNIQLKLCDIQGRLFERSRDYASENFIRSFMNSEVADHLDSPYNKLQWMGEEYLLDELKDEKDLFREGEKYSPDVLYWIGYIYRYWACSRGEKSRKIYRYAPAKTMKRNYMAFHTFDPDVAIDDLIEISRQRKQPGRDSVDHNVQIELEKARRNRPLQKEDFTPEELEKLKVTAPEEYRLVVEQKPEEEG